MSHRKFKPTGKKRMRAAKVASKALAQKRSTYVNRLGSATRQRALAIANSRTAGFLGLEKKFYDTMRTGAAIAAPTDATGGMVNPTAPNLISTPAQGDGPSDRDGKRIVIKSVQIKGLVTVTHVEGAVDVLGAATHVFVALVQDTQTNGAAMNSQDCFKNTTAAAAGAASPIRNLLYASRFRVLKEWSLDVTPKTLAASAANAYYWNGTFAAFECYLPLDIPVNFTAGTGSDVTNVVDNSLHMVAYCTSTAASPLLHYNARIRFMG